jgi:hypothetical protein
MPGPELRWGTARHGYERIRSTTYVSMTRSASAGRSCHCSHARVFRPFALAPSRLTHRHRRSVVYTHAYTHDAEANIIMRSLRACLLACRMGITPTRKEIFSATHPLARPRVLVLTGSTGRRTAASPGWEGRIEICEIIRHRRVELECSTQRRRVTTSGSTKQRSSNKTRKYAGERG